MTDESFNRALRHAAARGRPAGVCPDAAVLAAYADGSLPAGERRSLEAHASHCAQCTEHLALLAVVLPEAEEPRYRVAVTRWMWLVPVATAVLVAAVWVRLPAPDSTSGAATRALPSAVQEQPRPRPDAVAGPGAPAASHAPGETSSDANKNVAATPPIAAPTDGKQKAAPTEAYRDERLLKDASSARPAELAEGKKAEAQAAARTLAATNPAAAAPPSASPTTPPAAAPERETVQVTADVAQERRSQVSPQPPSAQAAGSASSAGARTEGFIAREKATDAVRQMAAAGGMPPVDVAAGPTFRVRARDGRVEASTDGGASWRVEMSDVTERLRAGSCLTDGTCWLVGDNGAILRRNPAGEWVRRPLTTAGDITAIVASSTAHAVLTGANGRFETVDAGTTWRAIR